MPVSVLTRIRGPVRPGVTLASPAAAQVKLPSASEVTLVVPSILWNANVAGYSLCAPPGQRTGTL